MKQLISQYGFLGYMQKFPFNPVTIFAVVVLIGAAILFMNVYVRRRAAEKFAVQNPGAALLTLHKRKIGNSDFGDNIRTSALNDEPVHWFFVKPAIPAIYLRPGENRLDVYAEWTRKIGGEIKKYKSKVQTVNIHASIEGSYSLEYYIPENRFIVGEFSL
jgi:Urocanate hydratase